MAQEEEDRERKRKSDRKERESLRIEDLESLDLEPRVETRQERFRNKNELAKKLANWSRCHKTCFVHR
jgi:hypothetical protein